MIIENKLVFSIFSLLFWIDCGQTNDVAKLRSNYYKNKNNYTSNFHKL